MSELEKQIEQEQTTQPAPQSTSKPKKKREPFNWLLWLTVILPTVASILYFGMIAQDQYISESSFIVRSAKKQNGLTGLDALFQSSGLSRSQDDIYAVQEYIRSRTALDTLSKQLPVRSYYEEKGDIFSRFDANESQQINQALLKKGEDLINKINDRARKDTITFAEQAVNTAQKKVRDAADELMQFRITNGVLDLKEQSVMQLNLISKLQDELITIQTQLDQVRAVTPDNPQISGLETREKSLLKEIARQTKMITGATGKSNC